MPCDGSGEITVINDRLSDFARLVAPARHRISRQRWILNCPDHHLPFPDDWCEQTDPATGELLDPRVLATEALVLARHENWKYVEGKYLDTLADTLVDDWWDFFAVRSDVGDLSAWVAGFWAANDCGQLESYISSRVTLFVAGSDGVRWDFFSTDPAPISAIHSQARCLSGFVVRPTTLREYLSVFYGGSQLQ